MLFILGSVVASGVVFEHRRLTTFLATIGGLTEMAWLATVLIVRGVFDGEHATAIFLLAGFIWLFAWLLTIRRWRFVYRELGSGKRDVVVLFVLAVVLLSAGVIQHRNGFIGMSWVAHGYYNGDSTTLIALVQRSLQTPGLVSENPFSGNGLLEYPTLIHAGIAEFMMAIGQGNGWLNFLPLLVYVQIIITVPMFFLLWDEFEHREIGKIGGSLKQFLLMGLILFVMGISWESYIYPQGHFFIMALFLLMGALLSGGSERICRGLLAATVVLVLIFSNAVTGTAALACFGLIQVWRLIVNRRKSVTWLLFIIAIGLSILFLKYLPGNGSLGWRPSFSYTAASGYFYVMVSAGLLLWSILERKKFGASQVYVVGLMILSLVTFIFSQRNIVVENSPRFIYHAILLGWPLMFGPVLILGGRWYELLNRLKIGWNRMVGIGLTLVLLFLIGLPVLISVAQVHDQLLGGDEHVIDLGERMALGWLNENSGVNDIVLASPDEPWSVPLLTGRALLRTNYWLSSDDEVQTKVTTAFRGDKVAQQEVMQLANYLVLRKDERYQWEPVSGEKKYDDMGMVIYEIDPSWNAN